MLAPASPLAAALTLCLLALAPPPAAAAAFAPGNFILTLVGDGTAAHSATPSTFGLADAYSQSHVDISVREYSVSAATGAFSDVGNVAVAPGASGLTVAGNLADVGNVNFTWQPWGGKLSLSNDGTVASFAGYVAPAGAYIGPSCYGGSLLAQANSMDCVATVPGVVCNCFPNYGWGISKGCDGSVQPRGGGCDRW